MSPRMTEAWGDRLDGPFGYRHAGIPRMVACKVHCTGVIP